MALAATPPGGAVLRKGCGLACVDELPSTRPHALAAAASSASPRTGALAADSVLEVVGAAGAGKTELLYYLAACTVAPPRWTDARTGRSWTVPGARGRHVVWVDVDLKASALRLAQVVRALLERSVADDGAVEAVVGVPDAVVAEALARLQIFRCADSLQVVATLHSLAFRPDLARPPAELCTVLLDGVASLYWQDRDESVTPDGQAFYQRQVVTALRRLQRTVPTAVVATRAALLGPPAGRTDLPPRDVMCSSWAGLVTHRLWLHQQTAARIVARPLPLTAGVPAWTLTVDDDGLRPYHAD